MKDHDKDLTTALMKKRVMMIKCMLSLDSILRVPVVSVASGVLNCHIIRKTRPGQQSLGLRQPAQCTSRTASTSWSTSGWYCCPSMKTRLQ
jgi:hypothetical protein